MPHVTTTRLHGYENRGLDIRLEVTTELPASAFSNVTFRAGSILKTNLTPADEDGLVVVEFLLTAAEMALEAARYPWECVATVQGEARTIAAGSLTVDPEPTTPAP